MSRLVRDFSENDKIFRREKNAEKNERSRDFLSKNPFIEVSAFLLWAKARNYSLLTGTVEPVLSGTVISGHPLLRGQFSKSRNLLPLMYCDFELY